ncbi:B12-binding domain-containing radical SAM protein [Candidatus Omnitrophota bacterium]
MSDGMKDKQKPKILLCNIALRDKADTFPPVACTTLCNILLKEGYDTRFYDIDAQRPSFEELSSFFSHERFGIVGISAVASTGYQYTKNLASIIKKYSPQTQIILGGNLASACEVILRKCDIDVCVIGEGEKVLLNLVRHWEEYGSFKPGNRQLGRIRGIAFLAPDGTCRITGHEKPINGDEIEQPDYELLGRFSGIEQYILDPMTRWDFAEDTRSYEAHRKGKKMATIFTSKGCVNRCTFCHRWVKGYRVISVGKVITAMKHLMDEYNVGFFCISVECFGENKQWVEKFIEEVGSLDILFQIAGARVSIIKKDSSIIRRLKEVGLTVIRFGMESGSDKILTIMEKNANRAQNLMAARVYSEAGVRTTIQLVIGMPGENEQTINETIEFVKEATGDLPYPSLLSINYLQSLPGTPCYEFLRSRGLIGGTIEDEERYLLDVSDINASEFEQYVNVSEEPLSKVRSWRMKINLLTRIHWLKRHGWRFPADQIKREGHLKRKKEKSVFSLRLFLKSRMITYRIIDLMGEFFWKIVVFGNCCSLRGLRKALLITFGLVKEEDRSPFKIGADPLRKILQIKLDGISESKGIVYGQGEEY